MIVATVIQGVAVVRCSTLVSLKESTRMVQLAVGKTPSLPSSYFIRSSASVRTYVTFVHPSRVVPRKIGNIRTAVIGTQVQGEFQERQAL